MYRAYARPGGDAAQPRHPPAARAPRGQRPPQDRAAQRAAPLAAGHARPLLRRRDRHGRQRLPRRPQRRPHADAVDHGPQRRASRAPTRSSSSCRSSSIPSTTTSRSTSRTSSRTRRRCSGGPSGIIALRKRFAAFGRGTIEFLEPDEPARARLRAAARATRRVLVVANLSRFVAVRRARSAAAQGDGPGRALRQDQVPRRSATPPYVLTLGPHGFYWFSLERAEA